MIKSKYNIETFLEDGKGRSTKLISKKDSPIWSGSNAAHLKKHSIWLGSNAAPLNKHSIWSRLNPLGYVEYSCAKCGSDKIYRIEKVNNPTYICESCGNRGNCNIFNSYPLDHIGILGFSVKMFTGQTVKELINRL